MVKVTPFTIAILSSFLLSFLATIITNILDLGIVPYVMFGVTIGLLVVMSLIAFTRNRYTVGESDRRTK